MGNINNTEPDVVTLAKNLYESRFRASVETPENIGKFMTIDTLSGDYEISSDILQNGQRLRERHPTVQTFTLRIGYLATFTRSYRMRRTTG